ncbi:MAG: S8 family serine peptidase [Lachnospiraceae bacterium]|nr:S8 family serine peptidase [Lachnospiraceae bacterium]
MIIKYSGDMSSLTNAEGVSATFLLGGYAIVTISPNQVEAFLAQANIDFVERPRQLFFNVENAIAASCIPRNRIFRRINNRVVDERLTGAGVIVGIIDSGIDYRHPDFRRENGDTRIIGIWDQSLEADGFEGAAAPAGYNQGLFFAQERINQSLRNPEEAIPTVDLSGHGTQVAGLAGGNGRASEGRYAGVAPDCDLLIVKLGNSRGDSFPQTAQLMEGIDFCVRTAMERQQPIAINISLGNNFGSHSGDSLVETYIDTVCGIWKNVICIGSGNEGGMGRHYGGRVGFEGQGIGRQTNEQTLEGLYEQVEIAVSDFQTAFTFELWKYYADEMEIAIKEPGGQTSPAITTVNPIYEGMLGETRVNVLLREPTPFNSLSEVSISLVPVGDYIQPGIWTIQLRPVAVKNGEFEIWLPAGNVLRPATRFLRPVEEKTLTIPSTAKRAITVGAYDSNRNTIASFSGRGFTWGNQYKKPELVAPGVDIISPTPGGNYSVASGTSVAAPIVSGSAAIYMEWGIVRGNDTDLYGEKLKALMEKNSQSVQDASLLPARSPGSGERGTESLPNPQWGWGALCVEDR